MAPLIYVSISNVLGEHSFRPSKTKPLPKWMSLLPNNRHQTRNLDLGDFNLYSVPGSHSADLVSSSACTTSPLSMQMSDHGSSTMSLSDTKETDISDDAGCQEPRIEASVYSSPSETRYRYVEPEQTSYLFRSSREHHSRPSLETKSLLTQIAQATEISASPLHTSKAFISDTPTKIANQFFMKDPSTVVVDSGPVGDRPLFPSSTERAHYTQKYHQLETGGVWKRYMARGAEPDSERLKRQRVHGEETVPNEDHEGGIWRTEATVQDGELDRRDQLRRELMGLFHDNTRDTGYVNGRSSA